MAKGGLNPAIVSQSVIAGMDPSVKLSKLSKFMSELSKLSGFIKASMVTSCWLSPQPVLELNYGGILTRNYGGILNRNYVGILTRNYGGILTRNL